ncbi:unnamed protein product [Closterium sp. NIES-64]|nr:unnamed protein product [Closterium sp. NIES-64]
MLQAQVAMWGERKGAMGEWEFRWQGRSDLVRAKRGITAYHATMPSPSRLHPPPLTRASPSAHACISFSSRIHPPPGGEQVEGGEGRGGGEGEQTRQHRLPGPCFCNRAPGGEQMEGGEGLGGGEGEQTRQRRLPG